MVDWKDEEIPCMASDFPSDSEHDHWRFCTRSFRDECWSILGDTLSSISSSICDKGKHLTFFTVLIIIQIAVTAISTSDLIISYQLRRLIYFVIYIHSMLFINYKLFTIARKSRRNNEISPEVKKSVSFKNVSSCLLVVACLTSTYIPLFICFGLRLTSKETVNALGNAEIAALWSRTTGSMNSTFSSLIFYWKDEALQNEGMKVIGSMNVYRRVQS